MEGQSYQFKCLAFGLKTTPRVFKKIIATLMAHFHSCQIQIYAYLDDWLIKSTEKRSLVESVRTVVQTSVKLGVILNWKKSSLNPSQKLEYLGADLNLAQGTISPTLERIKCIQRSISPMKVGKSAPAGHFPGLLGLMAVCIDLVPWGRVLICYVEFECILIM